MILDKASSITKNLDIELSLGYDSTNKSVLLESKNKLTNSKKSVTHHHFENFNSTLCYDAYIYLTNKSKKIGKATLFFDQEFKHIANSKYNICISTDADNYRKINQLDQTIICNLPSSNNTSLEDMSSLEKVSYFDDNECINNLNFEDCELFSLEPKDKEISYLKNILSQKESQLNQLRSNLETNILDSRAEIDTIYAYNHQKSKELDEMSYKYDNLLLEYEKIVATNNSLQIQINYFKKGINLMVYDIFQNINDLSIDENELRDSIKNISSKYKYKILEFDSTNDLENNSDNLYLRNIIISKDKIIERYITNKFQLEENIKSLKEELKGDIYF